MTPEEYLNHDAVGLLQRLSARDVRPMELVQRARERIERMNPVLNAVVHRFDAMPSDGAEPGPLHGLPFLLKDELEVEGAPMTLGSRLLHNYRPERTHPLARRMLDAGLHVLGRTNMSELGLVPLTEPRAHGPTRNPWDPNRSPGGSSGGAAAAVASGMVPLAHAADGGGSIRIPASACGLVGLKPTRGLLPVAPTDPPQGFVVHGCLSRTVRDTAAFLDAVQGRASRPGAGRRLSAVPPGSHLDALEGPVEPLRIGVTWTDFYGEPVHPDVESSLRKTADVLESQGHRVDEVGRPVDLEGFADAFRILWTAGAGVFMKTVRRGLQERLPSWGKPLLGSDRLFRLAVTWPGQVEPFTARLARHETELSPSDLWLAELSFHHVAEQFVDWFESFDLWLTCTLTQPPVPIGGLKLEGMVSDLERALLGYVSWTPIANATGLPAISVPGPASATGLPIGAHFTAAWGREDLLLRVARVLEQAQPWPRLAPAPSRAPGG